MIKTNKRVLCSGKVNRFFLLFLSISALIVLLMPMNADAKKIYGLYEKVQLPELDNVTVKAKLDTGAKTSSLGATNITFFEKNGEDWVRFQPQIAGEELPVLEKEIVRHSRIKLRSVEFKASETERSYTKRPVVMMDICFDGEVHAIELNLTDRSRFVYPLLLGSTALTQLKAVVDPSLKYQSDELCKQDT